MKRIARSDVRGVRLRRLRIEWMDGAKRALNERGMSVLNKNEWRAAVNT